MPKSPFNGQLPVVFQMTDDALVTFGAPVGPGAVSFTDVGYFPINAVTIGALGLDLRGKPEGLFIQYTAHGVQNFAPTGAPTTATYTDLHYDLVGYQGAATFGFAANRTPTVTGAKHETVLATGDLVSGQLSFGPTGGIAGQVNATVQVGGVRVGALALSVQHSAADIGPAAGGFTLTGGSLQATFVPNPGW